MWRQSTRKSSDDLDKNEEARSTMRQTERATTDAHLRLRTGENRPSCLRKR